MVGITASRLDDEVVRVSVLDFFTAQPLLDTLVRPNRRVADWRAGITGVSAKAMARAALGGEVLLGKEAAREALAEHVDENTVVVGHSVGCDLRALGVVHGRIVDSAILTAEPAFGEGKKLGNVVGLERLCRELLGLRIRGGAPAAGGRCHDSLEDVLATRELVVWCLRNPRDLEAWAVKNWGPGKKGRKKSGPRKRKLGGSDARSWSEDEDEDEEVLRWEDVVDWEVWPKSPPDYSD
jgi:DNA polymerase III epsilon subunit-like protein